MSLLGFRMSDQDIVEATLAVMVEGAGPENVTLGGLWEVAGESHLYDHREIPEDLYAICEDVWRRWERGQR
ncbi:MAG: hypothetical protein R2715_15030 [Ilumatobacteraceae bacterium]